MEPKLPSPVKLFRKPANNSKQLARVIKEQTQETDRLIAETDKALARTPMSAPVRQTAAEEKLSRLVDDDFPFDDTQLTAIYGLIQEQYGVMIGAAGTGKTTTTKKLVDLLRDSLDEIDVSQYWSRGGSDSKDDYEVPERLIPSIALLSFTGRATQMIKKNFPRDWHGNIMTIHRALGFYPEYFQDFDDSSGEMVNKRRFVPAYTAENLMPWDIIVVDEAGMLGLDLWHQLYAACKPTTRIILIGDINQLPPTHGKSILGFALSSWPKWELTHVHRQQGANNSIVDNAHRILRGVRPVCDSGKSLSLANQASMLEALNYLVREPDWRFLMVEVPAEHRQASTRIRQVLQLLQGKLYEPNRDVLITPINGFEQTAPGYSLGQSPLNQELVVKLNSDSPRYFIDAGRERQNFAVGDKVMATVNDYESGITNGMTGLITSIEENGAYMGDSRRWGKIEDVNAYLATLEEDEDDHEEFSLEAMLQDSQEALQASKEKEKRGGGPASHIVTVRFGEGISSFEIAFSSQTQVGSLMLAYAATCHKMQGGECPLVFGIVHQANRARLNREWLYTMVTRASEKCVMFYTRQGLGFGLGKQTISGTTLEAKVKVFTELRKEGIFGPTVKVKIPAARRLDGAVERYTPNEKTEPEKRESSEAQEREAPPRITINVRNIKVVVQASETPPAATPASETIIDAEYVEDSISGPLLEDGSSHLVSQWGAVKMLRELEDETEKLLLTHQPKPPAKKPVSLGELLRQQRSK